MVKIQFAASITLGILSIQNHFTTAAPFDEAPTLLFKKRFLNESALTGKFLHITDIHVDPHYLADTNPLKSCHRGTNKDDDIVGPYGALGGNCDAPVKLVDSVFKYLNQNVQDIDFILYTGDSARHDRDQHLKRTSEEVLAAHENVTQYFQNAYNLTAIPYIPVVGNNDSLDPDDFQEDDRLYGNLSKIWDSLNLNLTKDFRQGGYFVQDLIEDKLTLINLNSMFFYAENRNKSDCNKKWSPAAIELAWFENLLRRFQNKNASHQVYVMSHVAPLDNHGEELYMSHCHKKYLNLLGKYGSVISGHFTGHTNNDNLFAVVPDSKNDGEYDYWAPNGKNLSKYSDSLENSTMAVFNTPSIVPSNNPAFRVYHYNLNNTNYPVGTILNWDQYYLDLNDANINGTTNFTLEYKASELYGVDHYDGIGIGQAIMNISGNSTIWSNYSRYMTVSTKNISDTT